MYMYVCVGSWNVCLCTNFPSVWLVLDHPHSAYNLWHATCTCIRAYACVMLKEVGREWLYTCTYMYNVFYCKTAISYPWEKVHDSTWSKTDTVEVHNLMHNHVWWVMSVNFRHLVLLISSNVCGGMHTDSQNNRRFSAVNTCTRRFRSISMQSISWTSLPRYCTYMYKCIYKMNVHV